MSMRSHDVGIRMGEVSVETVEERDGRWDVLAMICRERKRNMQFLTEHAA